MNLHFVIFAPLFCIIEIGMKSVFYHLQVFAMGMKGSIISIKSWFAMFQGQRQINDKYKK